MDKIIFSRKELYDLVWAESLLSLSRKYEISDVGLRKACIRMDIPLPLAGHWQKIKVGKKVTKTPLPSDYKGESTFSMKSRGKKKWQNCGRAFSLEFTSKRD